MHQRVPSHCRAGWRGRMPGPVEEERHVSPARKCVRCAAGRGGRGRGVQAAARVRLQRARHAQACLAPSHPPLLPARSVCLMPLRGLQRRFNLSPACAYTECCQLGVERLPRIGYPSLPCLWFPQNQVKSPSVNRPCPPEGCTNALMPCIGPLASFVQAGAQGVEGRLSVPGVQRLTITNLRMRSVIRVNPGLQAKKVLSQKSACCRAVVKWLSVPGAQRPTIKS